MFKLCIRASEQQLDLGKWSLSLAKVGHFWSNNPDTLPGRPTVRFDALVSWLCSENASPRKKLKMAAVTKDENKAPAVDPKLTANKVNKKNPKGTTAECLSVFPHLGHFIVIECFYMAQFSAFAALDFFCSVHAGLFHCFHTALNPDLDSWIFNVCMRSFCMDMHMRNLSLSSHSRYFCRVGREFWLRRTLGVGTEAGSCHLAVLWQCLIMLNLVFLEWMLVLCTSVSPLHVEEVCCSCLYLPVKNDFTVRDFSKGGGCSQHAPWKHFLFFNSWLLSEEWGVKKGWFS